MFKYKIHVRFKIINKICRYFYFAGQYIELSVSTMDPGSAGSHRGSDLTGAPDGRVSTGSATVPNADCFMSDGLFGRNSDYRYSFFFLN